MLHVLAALQIQYKSRIFLVRALDSSLPTINIDGKLLCYIKAHCRAALYPTISMKQ